MNKLFGISAVVLALASASVFAQGTIVFNNDVNTRIIICPQYPFLDIIGEDCPLEKGGSAVRASLYYAAGPASVMPSEGSLALGTTATLARLDSGRFAGGNVTLTGVGENSPVWLQVRVWEAAYGNTYEEAIAAPAQNGRLAFAGQSAMWNMTAGSALAAPTIVQGGFTGFSMSVVPEPSTLALGLLGLAGLVVVGRHGAGGRPAGR